MAVAGCSHFLRTENRKNENRKEKTSKRLMGGISDTLGMVSLSREVSAVILARMQEQRQLCGDDG